MPQLLPSKSAERKKFPIGRMLKRYWPQTIVVLSRLCWEGNEKHNPGEDLHWNRGASDDHNDCTLRHFLEGDHIDEDCGIPACVQVAWRALCASEVMLEELYPDGVGAYFDQRVHDEETVFTNSIGDPSFISPTANTPVWTQRQNVSITAKHPYGANDQVEVMFRRGDTTKGRSAAFRWGWDMSESDIIKYRRITDGE